MIRYPLLAKHNKHENAAKAAVPIATRRKRANRQAANGPRRVSTLTLALPNPFLAPLTPVINNSARREALLLITGHGLTNIFHFIARREANAERVDVAGSRTMALKVLEECAVFLVLLTATAAQRLNVKNDGHATRQDVAGTKAITHAAQPVPPMPATNRNVRARGVAGREGVRG